MDLIRKANIRIIGIPEEEREEGGREYISRNNSENFPNLGKDLDIKFHEANRTPDYFNAKRSPRHITVKLLKSILNKES